MKLSVLATLFCASLATAAKVPNWTVTFYKDGHCKNDGANLGDEKPYNKCHKAGSRSYHSVQASPNTGKWTTRFYKNADCSDGGVPAVKNLCIATGVYQGYDEFKAFKVSLVGVNS